MADWIGRTLSKVKIQRLLGTDGMAEVYLGHHTTLNHPVAVKILHGYLTHDGLFLNRFRAEAQAVAALRHPNILQVLDFHVTDGCPYIVMELKGRLNSAITCSTSFTVCSSHVSNVRLTLL